MSRYDSRKEVAQKADYEGGLIDFITGYGCTVDDLPEGDEELRAALAAFLDAWATAEPALDAFYALLPEDFWVDDE